MSTVVHWSVPLRVFAVTGEMILKMAMRVAIVGFACLFLTGCGAVSETLVHPATRIYNRMSGFGYARVGQQLNAVYAITGPLQEAPYQASSPSPITLSNSVFGGSSKDPWRTLDVTWTFSKSGLYDITPMVLRLSSEDHEVNKQRDVSLGDWHVQVLAHWLSGPLREVDQSSGYVLSSLFTSYPIELTLKGTRAVDESDFLILTGAPKQVASVKILSVVRKGQSIKIRGVVLLQATHRMIELLPVLAYRVLGQNYKLSLMPITLTVFPSRKNRMFSSTLW